MNEKNAINLIYKAIKIGNYDPHLGFILQSMHHFLNNATVVKVYSDSLINSELIYIFSKRLENLSESDFNFGGFAETIKSLEGGVVPSFLVRVDTSKYHISILVNDDDKIIGAFFVEKDATKKGRLSDK